MALVLCGVLMVCLVRAVYRAREEKGAAMGLFETIFFRVILSGAPTFFAWNLKLQICENVARVIYQRIPRRPEYMRSAQTLCVNTIYSLC